METRLTSENKLKDIKTLIKLSKEKGVLLDFIHDRFGDEGRMAIQQLLQTGYYYIEPFKMGDKIFFRGDK